MTSIVIPAHNEESVIGRCLDAILADARPGEFEVVVASNGSTDRTVEIARSHGADVQVVESAVASKTAALNLADRSVVSFPRLYVDADVLVDTASVRKVAEVLERQPGSIAAPRLQFALADRPWTVRAFYDIWRRMPYLSEGLIGSGFYGLSEGARALFEDFPSTFAEDFFIRGLVPPDQRITVEGAEFTVHPPLSLLSLIKVRARIFAANRRSRDLFADSQQDVGGQHKRQLLHLAGQPLAWPHLAIYVGVVGLARFLALRSERRGAEPSWDRDQTARTSGL